MYVYLHICVYVYICVCIYIYVCVYIYVYVYMCVYVHVFVCACVCIYYTCIYIYIYIYICIIYTIVMAIRALFLKCPTSLPPLLFLLSLLFSSTPNSCNIQTFPRLPPFSVLFSYSFNVYLFSQWGHKNENDLLRFIHSVNKSPLQGNLQSRGGDRW